MRKTFCLLYFLILSFFDASTQVLTEIRYDKVLEITYTRFSVETLEKFMGEPYLQVTGLITMRKDSIKFYTMTFLISNYPWNISIDESLKAYFHFDNGETLESNVLLSSKESSDFFPGATVRYTVELMKEDLIKISQYTVKSMDFEIYESHRDLLGFNTERRRLSIHKSFSPKNDYKITKLAKIMAIK